MIGAGAKILGNIKVGDCARVAAGSVVLNDVPPRRTVAGVPAREIGFAGCEEPALTMDQMFADDDNRPRLNIQAAMRARGLDGGGGDPGRNPQA